METTGMSCIKYLLFIFNFIFAVDHWQYEFFRAYCSQGAIRPPEVVYNTFKHPHGIGIPLSLPRVPELNLLSLLQLSGIAIIVAGACVLKDVDDFSNFLENSTLAPPIVLIVAGIIVFLIAFLGCCGAIKESYNMLIAFAILLFIIFIIEIAVGAAAAVNKDSLKDELRSALKASKDNYDATMVEDRKIWAKLQSKLECCGVDGPNDWVMGGLYPASCCKNSDISSQDLLCGPSKEYVYQDGCFNKLSMKLNEGSIIVMGVGIGIALIELAGIVLSCLLASAIKKENEDEEKE